MSIADEYARHFAAHQRARQNVREQNAARRAQREQRASQNPFTFDFGGPLHYVHADEPPLQYRKPKTFRCSKCKRIDGDCVEVGSGFMCPADFVRWLHTQLPKPVKHEASFAEVA